MYGSQSTLNSVQSSQFGDYSDDEEPQNGQVDRFGFVLKSESNGPPELHTTISKNREREKKMDQNARKLGKILKLKKILSHDSKSG